MNLMAASGGGITLFHVRGIRIAVDYSWFFFLFLIILWVSAVYQDVLGPRESDTTVYGLAVLTAFAFFGSILLHELGHAFVSIRRGISISSITLWIFGGVTRMDRDSDSPGTEFKVAIAGPLVTLAIAVACIGIVAAAVGLHDFVRALKRDYVGGGSPLLIGLAWLGSINFILFVFNLVPAFPLDGGRIVRAIAWRVTGDRSRGTRAAAGLGRAFSFAFIGLGLALLVGGYSIDGLWLMLVGWVLGNAARGAIVQSEVTRRLGGITVADLMDSEPVAIPENVSVEDALDEYFLRYRWPWFFVVDAAHRFRGLVERSAADAVPEPSRASARIAEVVAEHSDDLFRVPFDAPLESLLANEAMRRFGALAAVDSEGRLRGVITAEQVGRALRRAVGAPPAGTPPAV
jgi:Zn-dependent protease